MPFTADDHEFFSNELFEEDRKKSKNIKGNAVQSAELDAIGQHLSEMFTGLAGKAGLEGVSRISILLTRYGITSRQQEENYSLLAEMIRRIVSKGDDWEVAFDITHSFRSMPMYNLAALQYIRSVASQKIDISHVYYGCYELEAEMNYAPVMDLEEIIRLMDLSAAVEEFKNTGRPLALVDMLKNDDPALTKALADFDWAMQTNSFRQVDEYTDALLQELEKPCAKSKFDDARGMIAEVLRNDLLNTLETSENLSVQWKRIDRELIHRADKQLLICDWHISKMRYGQASVIAHEALRSALVPLWLEHKKIPLNAENFGNETYRRDAGAQLMRLQPDCGTEAGMILIQAQRLQKATVDFRNRFAHNLS